MPYKTGKMKGELTTPEIRKLIKAHNILVSIKIPKGSKREDIIKLVEKNGYKVDHEKQALVPRVEMQRKKTIKLKKAQEITKPKPLTEEEKKKRQQAKQKKAGEKAFLKTVIPKPPPASKPSKGIKVKKPAQPNKKAPEPKPLPKKEAPKQRRKLKGRLTGVREKTTEEIEKLYPEFYAEDKELTMRTRGYIYDVLSVYHKIKSTGTTEQKKEARKVYEDFRGYKGTDKGEFDKYKKQFEMILKNDKEKPAVKKVEQKKEVKKDEPSQEKKRLEMVYKKKMLGIRERISSKKQSKKIDELDKKVQNYKGDDRAFYIDIMKKMEDVLSKDKSDYSDEESSLLDTLKKYQTKMETDRKIRKETYKKAINILTDPKKSMDLRLSILGSLGFIWDKYSKGSPISRYFTDGLGLRGKKKTVGKMLNPLADRGWPLKEDIEKWDKN